MVSDIFSREEHLYLSFYFVGKFNSGGKDGQYQDVKMGHQYQGRIIEWVERTFRINYKIFSGGAHIGHTETLDQKPNINNGQLQFTDSSVLNHLQL